MARGDESVDEPCPLCVEQYWTLQHKQVEDAKVRRRFWPPPPLTPPAPTPTTTTPATFALVGLRSVVSPSSRPARASEAAHCSPAWCPRRPAMLARRVQAGRQGRAGIVGIVHCSRCLTGLERAVSTSRADADGGSTRRALEPCSPCLAKGGMRHGGAGQAEGRVRVWPGLDWRPTRDCRCATP